MPQKKLQLSFFIALTLALSVLTFLVLRPYMGIIFVAAVFSVVFYPLYEYFLLKTSNKRGFSAILTILVIIFAIIVPLSVLSAALFKEAVGLYNSLAFGSDGELAIGYINQFLFNIQSFLPEGVSPSVLDVESHIQSVLSWIIGHFDSVFSLVFQGLLGFILMLISTYHLLKNGSVIKKFIVMWSPLPDDYDAEVMEALRSSIDAVFRGRFLVSIAQGFFLGLGFVIFGVSNPVLWGFVGAIASLIPALGTSLITIPAAAYLLITGHTGSAVGILIWGALAVGLVDDTLSFFILKRKIKIHPLITLFSILGGVSFFGPIGLIAGPVIVSGLIALLRVYPYIISYKSDLDIKQSGK